MKISDDLHRKLNEARMRSAMDKAVTQTTRELKDMCAMKAPKITGNLRRSHSYEVRRGGNKIEGLIKNSANYWQYVNFGTSKRSAKPFVTEALQALPPAKTIKKYFDEYYKTK